MPENSTVPIDRTSDGFDLTELLNGFRPLFDVLKPADVNKLTESVIKVLQGEGADGRRPAQPDRSADELPRRPRPAVRCRLRQPDAGAGRPRRPRRRAARHGAGAERVHGGPGRGTEDVRPVDRRDLRGRRHDRRVPRATSANRWHVDVEKTKALLRMYAAEAPRFGQSIDDVGSLMETLARVLSYRNGLTNYFCALDLDLGPCHHQDQHAAAGVLRGVPMKRLSRETSAPSSFTSSPTLFNPSGAAGSARGKVEGRQRSASPTDSPLHLTRCSMPGSIPS